MKPYHLVVPIAGRGQRMIDGGYPFPKPMLLAGHQTILDWSMQSVETSECELTFVVRRDHVCHFAIDALLRRRYGDDVGLVVSDGDTGGSVASVCLAAARIGDDRPLVVFCPDVTFTPRYVPRPEHFEEAGFLLTFKANSPNYSYVLHDAQGYVERTAEKLVISDNASVGIYGFRSGRYFLELAAAAMRKPPAYGKEYYVCPLYNEAIAGGGRVVSEGVEKLYVMGTPEELGCFESVIWPYLVPRRFVLCSDHSGYETKEQAKRLLEARQVPVLDVGCWSPRDCDYGDYVAEAVLAARKYPGTFVLGFCRSGQGVNIAANKHAGVRAALVADEHYAELAIRHNAANFFSIPAGGMSADRLARVLAILHTETFDGGRHQNRLMKIQGAPVHATPPHPDDAQRLVHRPLPALRPDDRELRGRAPHLAEGLPRAAALPRQGH